MIQKKRTFFCRHGFSAKECRKRKGEIVRFAQENPEHAGETKFDRNWMLSIIRDNKQSTKEHKRNKTCNQRILIGGA